MSRFLIRSLSLVMALASLLSLGTSTGVAQTSSLSSPSQIPVPPPLGVIVFQNSLQADDPHPLPRWESPSGMVIAEHVGEGYIVKLRGRWTDDSGLLMPFFVAPMNTDGEVRVEAKVVTGREHAMIDLVVRAQSIGPIANAYHAFFNPSTRAASVHRLQAGNGRSDLGMVYHPIASLRPDDWNSYAVRLHGNRIWLLVNDEPVLYTEDSTFVNGETLLLLIRTSPDGDRSETAAVFRDFRVAELAD